MQLPEGFLQAANVLIDSYFIIDMEHNIVDFNQAFRSMVPRPLARRLKTKKCHEVLQLDICKDHCIARDCWQEKRPIRLDEISGRVVDQDDQMIFILSAVPILDSAGNMIGVMEMQRNVTDEAQVQAKYQRQMEARAEEKARLVQDLQSRTRRLFDVSCQMYAIQRELFRLKTGHLG